MRFRRSGVVLGGILMVCLTASAAEERRQSDEDAKLNAVFHDYLKELFRREPLTATRFGEHAFDDQLDDLSRTARNATLEFKRQVLKKLPEQIASDKLSRDGKIDQDIFRNYLEREIWLAENFQTFEDDPRIYGDYISESVYLLLTQSSLPRSANLKNSLARMDKIPEIIAVARRTIGRSPRVKVETAISQTEGAIGFYTRELFELAGTVPGIGELDAKAGVIVKARGITCNSSRTTSFRDRPIPGESAATGSSRSLISNSMRGSLPMKCSRKPTAKPSGLRTRWV